MLIWTSERLASWLVRLPRVYKRGLMLTADAIFLPLALWCALSLKRAQFQSISPGYLWLYMAAVASAVPVFARLGLYRAVIRYLESHTISVVVLGVSVSTAAISLTDQFVNSARISIQCLLIYWALASLYMAGSRAVVRDFINHRTGRRATKVVIYGAGQAGADLARALRRTGRFHPVAFVDDSSSLTGSLVQGVEVFRPGALPDIIRDDQISTVLLAVPTASRRRRQEILRKLQPLGVRVQTVPDMADIVTGHATMDDVRDVDANDLLGRDPVAPDMSLLDSCVRGKSVMVTGAGGSIGSELCRQIIMQSPVRLVLFEMSEPALYSIDKELRHIAKESNLDVEIVQLLGNAHHKPRVREVIQAFAVQTVYHAAAYKHVPIVESNIVEGVHNNVFGTWYTAEAAIECGVETFVLISTDKAVNPTNVMGATKRLAEIVLQGLQERCQNTRLCMVRFGNVLESSGSVVPLFREQIQRGGPVTVTHKDVVRYFMTIPEASQLVIQAGSMATGGDVFVLNMGQPVRILDLARQMISMMGLSVRDETNPDGDVEIVYSGLRPGEKLYEELLIGNNVSSTAHSMIMRATEHSLPWVEVSEILTELLDAVNVFDCARVREILIRAVVEYSPSESISDVVWIQNGQLSPYITNVSLIPTHRRKLVAVPMGEAAIR